MDYHKYRKWFSNSVKESSTGSTGAFLILSVISDISLDVSCAFGLNTVPFTLSKCPFKSLSFFRTSLTLLTHSLLMVCALLYAINPFVIPIKVIPAHINGSSS